MMSTANTTARAMAMNCDGPHTRALLRDNAAAAQAAREAHLVLGTYDFTVESNDTFGGREFQAMTVSRLYANGELDLVTVYRALDDVTAYQALAIYETKYPLHVYVQAVQMRCAANRAAAEEASQ